MSNSDLIVTGLIFDIIGMLLLWKFGLPPDVRRDGAGFLLVEENDENEIKKGRIYDRLAHVAISLIVLGFVLQAVGTALPPSAFGRSLALPLASSPADAQPKAVSPEQAQKP